MAKRRPLTKRRSLSGHDVMLLARINGTPVSFDDIRTVVEDGATYRQRDSDDPESAGMIGMAIIASHFNSDDKALAVWFRMRALAKLLVEQGAQGWTLPHPDHVGCFIAHSALFAAAAVHPLLPIDNDFAFHRASFLDRVLRLASTKKTPQ